MIFSRRDLSTAGLLLTIWLVLVACTSTPQSAQEDQASGPVIPPSSVIEASIQDNSPDNDSVQTALASQGSDSAESEMEPVISTTSIEWNEDGTSVTGAESTLVRMKHGIYATFKTTGLGPGEAYTIWWVIFNSPQNCSDGECGPDDIFLTDEDGEVVTNDEGASIANKIGREVSGASILRATGSVIDDDGRAEFRAHLPLADTTEAGFGPGLVNPMAEIHLLSRTHGPVIAGLLHEQLNTPWGGCPEGWPKDPCTNTQVAVHSPPDG